jgi:putative integral membrane protein (TIGR02587 family)
MIAYFGELFLMVIGALFLALNVAPTQEIILIAYKQTHIQVLLTALLCIAIIHAFVYVIEFHGQHRRKPGETLLGVFVRYTLVGYALVLLISVYVLWVFGRTDGQSLEQIVREAVVLGLPAAVGAAAARLIF